MASKNKTIKNNGHHSNIFNCSWTNGTNFSPSNILINPKGKFPDIIILHQNYPNPFNSDTTIKFNLNKPSNIIINIYNTKGQIIKSLTNKYFNAGEYNIKWKGKDNHNQNVSSGLYFYQIETEGFRITDKMLIIK